MEALSNACAVVAGILMFYYTRTICVVAGTSHSQKVGKGARNYLPDLCGMLCAVCHCWGIFRSKPDRRC